MRYEVPAFELLKLNSADIITTSINGGIMGDTDPMPTRGNSTPDYNSDQG